MQVCALVSVDMHVHVVRVYVRIYLCVHG